MNGSPIGASNPDDLAVAVEKNSDKGINAVAKSVNEVETDIEEEEIR